MGKVVGLVGSASGKIGNMVYAVTNGIQTVRVYQPVVSNPKSSSQTRQRSKANLAGRISGLTPKTAIFGLGTNSRMRRGAFLKNLLLKADVISTSEGDYKAKVDNTDVIFSTGSVTNVIYNPSFTVGNNLLVVTLTGAAITAVPAEEYAKHQTRLVAMVYDKTTKELIEVVTKIATAPEQSSTAQTEMLFAHPEGVIIDIYAIPMRLEGMAGVVNSDMAMLDDNEIAAILSYGKVSSFEYGKSVYIGQATTPEAA